MPVCINLYPENAFIDNNFLTNISDKQRKVFEWFTHYLKVLEERYLQLRQYRRVMYGSLKYQFHFSIELKYPRSVYSNFFQEDVSTLQEVTQTMMHFLENDFVVVSYTFTGIKCIIGIVQHRHDIAHRVPKMCLIVQDFVKIKCITQFNQRS